MRDSPEALRCVLEQDTIPLPLNTRSTQEDRKSSRHDDKIVVMDVKHQHKLTKFHKKLYVFFFIFHLHKELRALRGHFVLPMRLKMKIIFHNFYLFIWKGVSMLI